LKILRRKRREGKTVSVREKKKGVNKLGSEIRRKERTWKKMIRWEYQVTWMLKKRM
jgi:hypothetical protein